MTSPVYERTVSAFPFSVGTSLAFESLFEGTGSPIDPDRQIPQKVDINDYSELWINCSTLFRNIYSAIPSDRVSDTVARDCLEVLTMEMQQIRELVNEESQGKTKVVYYICTYKGLDRDLKGIVRREPTTAKQMFYAKLHNDTLKLLTDSDKDTKEFWIEHFDVRLHPKERLKALIITHYAVDLLSYKSFRSLDLLESHTGVLKSFNTWYTKYFNGRELMMIPFNEYLIKIFGDNDLIVPLHFKVRRLIRDLAIANKWNYSTNILKVRNDVSTIKDHYARNELLKLLT